MRNNVSTGVIAGLIAGVVFGGLMQMMTAPTPAGRDVPMMMMVARVVRSDSLVVGWLYHLVNSGIIGGTFGWLLGVRTTDRIGSGIGWGAVYGIGWWIIGALILMPLLLGMPAFAPLRMPPMQTVAMASLMGHLIFGGVLGLAFVWLRRRTRDHRLASAGAAR